jgi:hypothetical protein
VAGARLRAIIRVIAAESVFLDPAFDRPCSIPRSRSAHRATHAPGYPPSRNAWAPGRDTRARTQTICAIRWTYCRFWSLLND